MTWQWCRQLPAEDDSPSIPEECSGHVMLPPPISPNFSFSQRTHIKLDLTFFLEELPHSSHKTDSFQNLPSVERKLGGASIAINSMRHRTARRTPGWRERMHPAISTRSGGLACPAPHPRVHTSPSPCLSGRIGCLMFKTPPKQKLHVLDFGKFSSVVLTDCLK